MEYFGFSLLCGFVSLLFFTWASGVIADNYIAYTGTVIDIATRYFLKLASVVPGIMIFLFTLIVLVRKKFAYMVTISHAVEEMEAGNLDKRIPPEGDDELTDLAVCINRFAETIRANQDAAQALKEEELHMIATLSHDLRTPLTSVMSYLQFIRDGNYADKETLEEYARKAYDKACRIKRMTDELFESCKTQKEPEIILTKVDGRTFAEQIVWDMQEFLVDAGYKTRISLPESWPALSLTVDVRRIPSVMDNLLSNVRKYAEKDTPVTLEVRLEEDTLLFCQKNRILSGSGRILTESSLLGLPSIEKTIAAGGGTLSVSEQGDIFVLEIRLPVIRET